MNRIKDKKLFLFILADVILVLMMVIHTVTYITALRKNSLEDEKKKFEQSVNVISHQVTFYMDNSRRIVKDWVHLIERRDWTFGEIAGELGDINSDDRIMIMVLSADELTGYAVTPDADGCENNSTTTSYDKNYNLFRELSLFRETASAGDVYITSTFTNAISGEQCIAFVALINVRSDDSDEYEEAFLMRVEPLEVMKENWFFSSTYSSAQISMINSFGDYIYRAPMLKNSNFYEFLISYNDITYPELYELMDDINGASTRNFILRNSSGKDTLFALSARGYNDWIIVGSIELSNLSYPEVQWSLLISPLFTFVVMIALSMLYFNSLNRKLRASMKDLEKANAAKTQFLSSMSHDIRTPMNAIMGLTTIAERSLDDRERVENCLSKISLAGGHLLTLINDILDISQVESGRFALNPVTFSLSDSAEDLVNIIYPQALEKRLVCSIRLVRVTEEYLYADKLRLNQIWLNILSNAVKYTPEGGSIDITIEEFIIEDDPSSIGFIFRTADTGTGMTPEFMEHIFEPFVREKDSRIDKVQGSGLGMAITKQIVDLLGGTIKVESEVGKGSVFTVTLVLKRGNAAAFGRPFDGQNILLIGGDDCMNATKQFVGELGGAAEIAADADSAVWLIENRRSAGSDVSLVIIDRKMAEISCVDTARTIRDRFGAGCPVMLISAFDFTDIEHEAELAGVEGFLSRPIFKTALVNKYNTLMQYSAGSAGMQEEYEDFSGARLLVAEDNDINWEIIDDLLKMYGIAADRAENGKECVDIMRSSDGEKYDMIFMDIQMPVMNGYEATREIRALGGAKGSVPIVAMTANAFAEDVTACINAGMNGHISKPVDIKLLLAEIRKYIVKKV